MSAHFQRAQVLYSQSRYDMAAEQLRQGLAEDPEDSYGRALLGLCLSHLKKLKEATTEVEAAIHAAPDNDFAHYAHAWVLHDRNKFKAALESVEEALRLDPEAPDYWALKAAIQLDSRQWPPALHSAEQGLNLDAEHVQCANLRAMALVRMGRKAEAGQTIDATLAKNPEDATSHANQGWAYLDQAQPKQAMVHFKEALRLDPDMDWARAGMVEALKSQYVVYGLMLRYFLWMGKLSQRAQWGIIIGGYLSFRVVSSIQRKNPELSLFLTPLIVLYVVFVILTWIADPLFNLILRLNRFGRMALSREQIVASNWVGGVIAIALGLLGYWLASSSSIALIAAMIAGFLVIPTAGIFRCAEGWPRTLMAGYTVLLAAAGVGSLITGMGTTEDGGEIKGSLFAIFIIGVVLSGWVANALNGLRPER